MHKILVAILLLFILITATSMAEKKVITGQFSWQQWKNEAGWENYDITDYKPNLLIVDSISITINHTNFMFKIFSGSWCHDSEMEMPKIIALLLQCGVSENNIQIWGVDRDKHEPNGMAEHYEIIKVPTLIIERNSIEIGRIVEYPETSWEQDILEILKLN